MQESSLKEKGKKTGVPQSSLKAYSPPAKDFYGDVPRQGSATSK